MTVVYNPFSKSFNIYWPENPDLDSKQVDIPDGKVPYRRILCWRARHNSIRSYDLNLLTLSQLCEDSKSSELNDEELQKSSTKKWKRKPNSDDSWNIASKDQITEKIMKQAVELQNQTKLPLQYMLH